MLKLKKLSVQASDEEDEPGMMCYVLVVMKWLLRSHMYSDMCSCLSAPQSSPPAKETKRIRYVSSLLCTRPFTSILLTLHILAV